MLLSGTVYEVILSQVKKLWWRSLLLAMSQSEQVWLAEFLLGFERVVML